MQHDLLSFFFTKLKVYVFELFFRNTYRCLKRCKKK